MNKKPLIHYFNKFKFCILKKKKNLNKVSSEEIITKQENLLGQSFVSSGTYMNTEYSSPKQEIKSFKCCQVRWGTITELTFMRHSLAINLRHWIATYRCAQIIYVTFTCTNKSVGINWQLKLSNTQFYMVSDQKN